jgi:muramoyltetrapeptide carboxypeptidase
MQANFIILIISLGLFCCINGTIKVPRIKPGDTIGFISPASPVSGHEKDIGKYKERVISSMMKLGLKVEWSKYAFGPEYGYFAATNEERAADVMSMFQNRNITAIISNRGGWGCDRIVELLDFEIIKKNPKALIGYSDLTTLINSIYHLTSIVTFHGPMGIDDWSASVWNSIYFREVMMEGKLATFSNQDNFPITTIKSGKARGILVGGNLCVYTSMMGSTYIPNSRNEKNTKFILFLEEVGEAPYRVDRMITTLQLSGFLKYEIFDKKRKDYLLFYSYFESFVS